MNCASSRTESAAALNERDVEARQLYKAHTREITAPHPGASERQTNPTSLRLGFTKAAAS